MQPEDAQGQKAQFLVCDLYVLYYRYADLATVFHQKGWSCPSLSCHPFFTTAELLPVQWVDRKLTLENDDSFSDCLAQVPMLPNTYHYRLC